MADATGRRGTCCSIAGNGHASASAAAAAAAETYACSSGAKTDSEGLRASSYERRDTGNGMTDNPGYEAAIAMLSNLITLPPAPAAAPAGGAPVGQRLQNDGFASLKEKWMPLLAREAARRAGRRAPSSAVHGVDVTQETLRGLRVIHVAGTKGKGSTCAMLESVLRECGYRTGLFTSPHLFDVTERFRIDGAPVDKRVFSEHFWQLWRVLHASDEEGPTSKPQGRQQEVVDTPSSHRTAEKESSTPAAREPSSASPFASGMPGYFRFLTLLAFHIFTSMKVDVAIMEVGLGGRLDATNVIDHPVVSGITLLDYDHTEILGDTLALIAKEKAGIMKDGVNVKTVQNQTAEAMKALAEAASGRRNCQLGVAAPLHEYRCGGADDAACERSGVSLELGLAGHHQRDNAALAVSLLAEWFDSVSSDAGGATRDPVDERRRRSRTCAEMLRSAEPTLPPAVVRGLERAHWPGRCQVVDVAPRNPRREPDRSDARPLRYYLDGAHTAESIKACADWFRAETREDATQGPSSAPSETTERVLIFHCMAKRDPMQLFGPLVSLHADIRFGHILFVPLDSSVQTLKAANNCTRGAADGAPAPTKQQLQSVTAAHPWLENLRETWSQALDREAERGGCSDPLADVDSIAATAEVRPMACIQDALDYVDGIVAAPPGREADPPPNRVEVLVTGSLYLVGDVLKHLDRRT